MSCPSLGSWTLNEVEAIKICQDKFENGDYDQLGFAMAAISEMFRLRGCPIKERVGDLKSVPNELLIKVWEFFRTESDWLRKHQDEEDSDDAKKPIGKGDTGNFKEPTPATLDSAVKPSETAQSTFSNQPSKTIKKAKSSA